jgi:aryl-alcohol dehydrogenase-like predicted oxidoreductase
MPTDTTTDERSGPIRVLGRSGIEVSALGVGCWAIGGPWTMGASQAGWGAVDDDESVRALRAALEAGVNFFDTAATYGAGHSETVLGRALGARRSEIVLATKFGFRVEESGRHVHEGADVSRAAVERSCADSLRRLGTDRIDLLQLHVGDLDVSLVDDVIETLEGLVTRGMIRAYGWSTDDVERARRFAAGPHCTAVQHRLNVLEDAPEMLALCADLGLAAVNRSPLAMGLLAGRYDETTRFDPQDLRAHRIGWMDYFLDGRPDPRWLARVEAVREILTSGGRTLAQGALAWIWARSPVTVPVPGVRTVAQAESNAGALVRGPLTAAELAQVERILAVEPA